jgi:hypothetical protein
VLSFEIYITWSLPWQRKVGQLLECKTWMVIIKAILIFYDFLSILAKYTNWDPGINVPEEFYTTGPWDEKHAMGKEFLWSWFVSRNHTHRFFLHSSIFLLFSVFNTRVFLISLSAAFPRLIWLDFFFLM